MECRLSLDSLPRPAAAARCEESSAAAAASAAGDGCARVVAAPSVSPSVAPSLVSTPERILRAAASRAPPLAGAASVAGELLAPANPPPTGPARGTRPAVAVDGDKRRGETGDSTAAEVLRPPRGEVEPSSRLGDAVSTLLRWNSRRMPRRGLVAATGTAAPTPLLPETEPPLATGAIAAAASRARASPVTSAIIFAVSSLLAQERLRRWPLLRNGLRMPPEAREARRTPPVAVSAGDGPSTSSASWLVGISGWERRVRVRFRIRVMVRGKKCDE